MTIKSVPYFGEFDIDNLDEVYDGVFTYKDNTVVLDCWFLIWINDSEKRFTQISETQLNQLIETLNNLPALIAITESAYKSDFEKSGQTTESYVNDHLEDLDTDVLETLLVNADKTLPKSRQLLSKLHLVRLGFYPFNPDKFLVFDYKIGKHCTLCDSPEEEITNQLLVVVINDKKEIVHITAES
jgi:hypothetical protein